MNTPHKHAALIKQWADGAIIQYYNIHYDKWMDTDKNAPYWNPDVEYRVKPVTRKYRVALMRNFTKTVDYEREAEQLVYAASFVRWLTDWIEYEV